MIRRARKLPKHVSLHWIALLTTLWLGCAVDCHPLAAEEPQQGTLHWHNGDQLPGRLLWADANTLQWQSTLFATPFKINIAAISSIDYPSSPSVTTSDQPFRLVTVTSDVLLGDLIEFTDEDVVITSPRHGQLRLKRSQLVGLQRHNRKSAGSVGLGLLADWKTLHHGRQISEWARALSGQIVTKVTGAELYRDLHMTGLSEIEITLSWSGKPGFMISFADPNDARLSKQVVKLETWENDLVLQTLGANGDFEVIDTIPARDQSIELRMIWNPVGGELSVHSAMGQMLGKMKGVSLPTSNLTGLFIQNKGATLKLVKLRANGWDGAAKELPAGSIRVRTADAKTVTGKIMRLDTAQRILIVQLLSGDTRTIPLDQVDGIDLGNRAEQQSTVPPARISFIDGTQISGGMKSVRDGIVNVGTPYCDNPIRAKIDGVFSLHFARNASEGKVTNQDLLTIGNGRLRGELVAVADQANAVGWRPVGGVNAAVLPVDQPYRLTRKHAPSADTEPVNRFLDRIFLRNGDALPCIIHGIDATHLDIDVPHTGNSRIDRAMVVAIEFGRHSGSNSRSFADPQWIVVPANQKAVTRSDAEMVVRGNAVIGYDNISDADEVAFDVQWNMSIPAIIRISIFSNGPDQSGQGCDIMLYRTQGTRVMLQAMRGMRAGPGIQIGGMGAAAAALRTHDGGNSFRFRIYPKKIVVYESEKQVLQIPIDRSRLKGKSLTLNVQSVNAANARMLRDAGGKPVLVTLRNPIIRRGRGDVLNVLADEQQRNRLLTIPRFRKQRPPTEVLVGFNGDLLRGRLDSLDDKRVMFVSRLDEITLPRQRLAGIIWPQTEEARKESADAAAGLACVLFKDGSNIRMTAEKIVDDALVGQHPALGQIAIPISQMRELTVGNLNTVSRQVAAQGNPFAAWTLRPALEPKFANAEGAGSTGSGSHSTRGGDSPLVGKPAPDFSAKLLDGSRFRASQLKGKVTVLDFWATWCGPCVKSMPETAKTVAEFPADKVMLLAVNQLETAKSINQFLENRGWEINVALDDDGKIGQLFHVDAIPQLVVIDDTGTVQRVFVGAHDDLPEELKQVLTQLTSQ